VELGVHLWGFRLREERRQMGDIPQTGWNGQVRLCSEFCHIRS